MDIRLFGCPPESPLLRSVAVNLAAIIATALGRIAQDCIGPRDIFETLRNVYIGRMEVWMELLNEATIRALNLRIAVVTRYSIWPARFSGNG